MIFNFKNIIKETVLTYPALPYDRPEKVTLK